MRKHSKIGLERLKSSWFNSCAGLRDAWDGEEAFRIETALFICSIPVAILIANSIFQIGLLIGSLLLLMIVEILNSAIEATIDRIGTEKHDLSRSAKDLGSAAVLLTAFFPASVWVAVLIQFF